MAAGGQAEREPEMHPCDKEDQQPGELHEEAYCPQVKRGDPSPLLSTRETCLGAVPQCGLPNRRETQTYGRNSAKGHKDD